MPDEILITKIENMLAEIVRLGGENERSQMVPNLTVQNANPSGLDGFIIVSDDRDGDNIVAKKVGSVIYADNDLVNVIFPHGGEAIAFQQGSQSANSGIWEIVPSTTTDIFYDKGNVGIGLSTPESLLHVLDSDAGIAPNSAADVAVFEFSPTTSNGISLLFPDDKIGQIAFGTPSDNIGGRIRYFGPTHATVSRRDAMVFVTRGDGEMIITGNGEVGIGTLTPDAQLESFDATGTVQLRLSFEDSVKFTDLSVDTSHHLTINPSSTGQIKLASADVTIEEDLLHEGDEDTKFIFTTDKIAANAGGINLLALTETAQDLVEIGDVAGGGDVDVNFNSGQMFIEGSSGEVGVGTVSPVVEFHVSADKNASTTRIDIDNRATAAASLDEEVALRGTFNSVVASQIITGKEEDFTVAANRTSFLAFWNRNNGTNSERMRIIGNGNVGIGDTAPGSLMEWNFSTEDLEFVDAGSAGATEQDWIEVQVGGVTGYIRVFAAV